MQIKYCRASSSLGRISIENTIDKGGGCAHGEPRKILTDKVMDLQISD